MSFEGMFYGTVEQVFPPDHQQNLSKYQYEYQVMMIGDLYSTVPIRAIYMDSFPHVYGSEERILDKGSKVFIQFPRNMSSVGVIVGGSRSRPGAMATSSRAVLRNRINETEYEVGEDGELTLRLRNLPDGPIGPEIEMTKDAISIYADKLLSNNGIVIDRTAKKISILTGDWSVTTTGDATLTIAGDASINVKGAANVNASEVSVKTKKLSATVLGNAEVTVSGKLTAKAQFIELNGSTGGVLTTESQPTCYVTGVPFMGSLTVKAGR